MAELDIGRHCAVFECKQLDFLPVTCHWCQQQFWHRHQADHRCEKLEAPPDRMAGTREHVKQILEKQKERKPGKALRSQKAKATAAKVALMKLKQKATGDRGVPDTEKVYLQVLLPEGTKERVKPLYFSKKWSVGRVIDFAANAASLKNMNNVAGAKKLRLFDADSGNMFATDVTLEWLMGEGESVILSGGSVILEYVDDGISNLQNVDTYAS